MVGSRSGSGDAGGSNWICPEQKPGVRLPEQVHGVTMNPLEGPIPQVSGQLVPPSRRPPTALGLAMLPAPVPPRRQFARYKRSIRNHPLVKTAEWMSLGSAVAWFAPWAPIRIAGVIFATLGFGAGTTWLVRRFVIRLVSRAWSRWHIRRKSRGHRRFAAV